MAVFYPIMVLTCLLGNKATGLTSIARLALPICSSFSCRYAMTSQGDVYAIMINIAGMVIASACTLWLITCEATGYTVNSDL